MAVIAYNFLIELLTALTQHPAGVGDAIGQQRGVCRPGRGVVAGMAMQRQERVALLRRIVPGGHRLGRRRPLRRMWRATPPATEPLAAHRRFGPAWPPMPAGFSLGSVLTNLFARGRSLHDRPLLHIRRRREPSTRWAITTALASCPCCWSRSPAMLGGDDHAALEPRLGSWPARTGRRPTAAVPEAVRLRVVCRGRGGAGGRAAAVPVVAFRDKFPGGQAVLALDVGLLHVVRHVPGGANLSALCREGAARRAWRWPADWCSTCS